MNRRTFNAAFIFGVAALLFLQGASAAKPKSKSKSPSKSDPAANYFPLRVGDSWTYRNSEAGGYTWKVLSEEPHEGEAVRYTVEVLSGVKILNTFSKANGWVLLHGENYLEHEGLQATYDPPKQYLANPLVVGQKWESTGKDPTQVEHHEVNRVVGVETVTVPAGKIPGMKIVNEVSKGGGVFGTSSEV